MRHKFYHCLILLTIAFLVTAPLMQAHAQPKIKGNDLVVNGESFFQASNTTSELSRLAKADGILDQNDNFKMIAVSGAPIASIVGFYKNCNPKPTYLISDGAGIDLMSGNCSDASCSKIQSCKNTLLQYIEEMIKGGTKKLLWMIYPDPQGGNWATLKKNQDIWAEVVPEVMEDVTELDVYIVDLRETWEGHYSQYTSDGIHQTSAGGTATAEAFWEVMTANNYEFFDTSSTSTTAPKGITTTTSSLIVNQVVVNGNASVSLSVDRPSNVSFQLISATGRSIFSAERLVTGNGQQTVVFPLGSIAPGIYCCNVKADQTATRATILIP